VIAPGTWALANRVLVTLFAVLVAAGLWRFGMVRAVPTSQGLRVINLIYSRELEWAEILRVGLAGSPPRAMLGPRDTADPAVSDTEELAVMGIQRADGAFARAEAARLAALVEHHSR